MKLKLQEFAKEKGVTDRAIQKHIQNHLEDLLGHVERRGPKGTWLDEYAQEYISNLMYDSPPVIMDTELIRKHGELEQKYQTALEEISRFKDVIAEMKSLEARVVAAEAANQLLAEARDDYRNQAVEARQEAKESLQRFEQAQGTINDLTAQIAREKARNEFLMGRGLIDRILNREV